jgi:hypothetical protein
MKLKDYGRLVKSHPNLALEYEPELIEFIQQLPDELVAHRNLQNHPEDWDLISPAVRRLESISHESVAPDYLFPFFHGVQQTNIDTRDRIDTIAKEAELLHRLDVLREAALNNVPAEALPQMAVMTHQTDEQIRLMNAQLQMQYMQLQYKLEFAQKEIELKRSLGLMPPAGVSDGQKQIGEVRRRNVPKADGKKVGRRRKDADDGRHRRDSDRKSND